MENSTPHFTGTENNTGSAPHGLPAELRQEILKGLALPQKTLSPKFLYDKRGSELFEKICEVKEYYPTRTEIELLKNHANEMADFIGPNAVLIEPGAGNERKVRFLLDTLVTPQAYVPIEISSETLFESAAQIEKDYPGLTVTPVCADYTQSFLPPEIHPSTQKKVVFFPGSTIGNMNPTEAHHFLAMLRQSVGHGGGLLIGVDTKPNGKKDIPTLERAYDDAEGVTADFNLNLLLRLNRDLNATYDLNNFKHKAFYNSEMGRIEMHLESLVSQIVKVDGHTIRFLPEETIHTESSYKYSIPEFSALAGAVGFQLRKTWTDVNEFFCIYYFEA